MTMESDLYTLLKAKCARVFPETAPALTATPYAIYQQMGGQVINPMDNSAPGLRNARIIVKVWSTVRSEAVSIADQIEDAMRNPTGFKARPVAARFNDYDEDLNLYGTEQEFSLWY